MARVLVLITGQVQGVGYRFYARQEMKALGVGGWVRNVKNEKLKIENGQLREFTGVEAMFEGEEKVLREMIAWCWEGSPTANVKDVEVRWEV